MGDGEATESYQLSRGARGDQTDHVASCQAREQGKHVNKATVASAGEGYWESGNSSGSGNSNSISRNVN
jgi:hypothetical protein